MTAPQTYDKRRVADCQDIREFLMHEARNFGFLCGLRAHRAFRQDGYTQSCRAYLSGLGLSWEREQFVAVLSFLGLTEVEEFMSYHFERYFWQGYLGHCRECLSATPLLYLFPPATTGHSPRRLGPVRP
jgi:hypothetical protein